MESGSSHALLNMVFAYLPDREVERLRRMPVEDPTTHIQALTAVRSHGIRLPEQVATEFIDNLTQLLA